MIRVGLGVAITAVALMRLLGPNHHGVWSKSQETSPRACFWRTLAAPLANFPGALTRFFLTWPFSELKKGRPFALAAFQALVRVGGDAPRREPPLGEHRTCRAWLWHAQEHYFSQQGETRPFTRTSTRAPVLHFLFFPFCHNFCLRGKEEKKEEKKAARLIKPEEREKVSFIERRS